MSKRQTAINLMEYQKRLARAHLLPFVDYCFQGVEYDVRWHNTLVCGEIDNWLKPDGPDNIILEMPPRHGKSEIISRNLPPYLFGRWPDSSIIAASYNLALQAAMSRDAQRVMVSDEYAEVFPDTRLAGVSKRVVKGITISQSATTFEIVGHRGRYLGAGVGTGIGGHGANFGIIDDPFKDRAEAESQTVRDNVWAWYTSTFRTRLEPGAKQIILMTRWHDDDLAGRLIKHSDDPEADQWRVIALPALFEEGDYNHPGDLRKEGEALWPEKYDVAALNKIKATIGTYDWSALFQQAPAPAEGAVAKRQWFRFVDKAPEGLNWVRFWDLAVSEKATADDTAGIRLACDRDGNYYINSPIEGKWEWPMAKRIIIQNCLNEPTVPVGVESVGTQKGLADDLVAAPELQNIAISGYQVPKGNKLVRALVWFARLEAGKVFLVRGPWNDHYIDDVTRFRGLDGDRDHLIDATSGAWNMLQAAFRPYFQEIGVYA